MKSSLKQQKGINLIELMIASVLSIMILYFMMAITTSSDTIFYQSEGVAQTQETGRFAISWLENTARRGGYASNLTIMDTQSGTVPPLADVCPAAMALPPAANSNCTFDTTENSGDRLAIVRMYSSSSDDPNDATDCTGVALEGLAGLISDETTLTDVYWIDGNYDTSNSDDSYDDTLKCVTYNNTDNTVLNPAQTLASGIEGMQLLYAFDLDGDELTPGITPYIPATAGVSMGQARAVRISLLTRSFSDHTSDQKQRSYVLLDALPYTFDDRATRQIMTTTVAFPNY